MNQLHSVMYEGFRPRLVSALYNTQAADAMSFFKIIDSSQSNRSTAEKVFAIISLRF
jgi:hypothetical protein